LGWSPPLELQRGEELLVGRELADFLQQKLHRRFGRQRRQRPPHQVKFFHLFLRIEFLLLAGPRLWDVDAGEDPFFEELTVEHDFHVAGALELLEDDLVHTRAGVDEAGSNHRQAATVLDVSCRAEEAARLFHRPRVNAT
jgi:hypothetical protein